MFRPKGANTNNVRPKGSAIRPKGEYENTAEPASRPRGKYETIWKERISQPVPNGQTN